MSAQRTKVTDDGRESKYFHQLLNMADDDLDPYQYRLYGHYKRVCGEHGSCWEGTRKTAAKTKMSVGKVSQARFELAEMGYINIEEPPSRTKPITVTLIDRMADNIARYSGTSGVHQVNTGVHVVNTGVHQVNESITIEEEPEEEDVKDSADASGAAQTDPPESEEDSRKKADGSYSVTHTEMKNAIVAAFGWKNEDVVEWGVIDKAAKKLRQARVSLAEVRGLHAQCAVKFTQFGPAALAKEIPEWRKRHGNGTGAGTQGITPTIEYPVYGEEEQPDEAPMPDV